MDSNMVQNQSKKVNMLSSTWAAKASTKYETYLVLQTEVMAYLPRVEHVTIYFLKDIIGSRKKCKFDEILFIFDLDIKQNQVRYLYVP